MNGLNLERLDGICYVTNLGGEIVDVGATQWNSFAADNGAAELDAKSVVGRNIFECISGSDVRVLLKQTLKNTASGKKSGWKMPINCGAINRGKCLQQSILPIRKRKLCVGFLFQSLEVDAEQRLPTDHLEIHNEWHSTRGDEEFPLVMICSWCQRIQDKTGAGETWIETEVYLASGGSSKVRASHGICKDCMLDAGN